MDTTSLDNLLRESPSVSCLDDGLRLKAESQWIVDNETKLSYTTIIRLVECCREHHWQKDIRPLLQNSQIDSTCRFIKSEFFHPIEVNQVFDIIYTVKAIRNHSYCLQFTISNTCRTVIYAEVELVMVFLNIWDNKPVAPPEKVLKNLENLFIKVGK
jgi:acyl-CoA thioesterase FadM